MLTAQPEEPDFSGEPITLSIEDADLNDVLATFSKISGFEILVEPGITGTVTMNVDRSPWDGALVSIVQDQGLEWERQGNQIIIRRPGSEKLMPPQTGHSRRPPAPPASRSYNSTVHKYVEGGGIEPPRRSRKLPPKYPPEMRKPGISGWCVADLVIDEGGG